MTSSDLERRKLALIAEIHEAFHGVSRADGVSWTQSIAEDLYWTPEQLQESGLMDTDQCWEDLIDDESWRDAPGVGGFNFLDPIGFRYYLPAAMIRDLRRGYSETLDFNLRFPPPGAKDRNWHIERLSKLDHKQRQCVASFVRFSMDRSIEADDDLSFEDWQHAWENYWKSVAGSDPDSNSAS